MKNEFSELSVAETLCPIGDLCKVCGVTRRMVLNYEDHGLIRPISVNPDSGHRYYGAQSVARIRHIKSLQKAGLSLEDIGRFFSGDESTLKNHLDDLRQMRDNLDNHIARTEALLTPMGEFTVRPMTLPERDCVMTTKLCQAPQERFLMLWEFTAYVLRHGWQVSDKTGLFAILHTNPQGPYAGMTSAVWPLMEPNGESVHFNRTEALYVNMKGPYNQIPQAIQVLRQYAAAHGLPSDGDIHLVYLTSPQSHISPENFVTQVVLPV